MNFEIFALSLLCFLEDYLPYMTEEEVAGILLYGFVPDGMQIAVWDIRRRQREEMLDGMFNDAFLSEKESKTAEKPQQNFGL